MMPMEIPGELRGENLMQKKIIALAIAGLSATSAFAADNVTLYGVADMYVGTASASWNGGSINRQSLVNSGGLSTSRLGFKGTEDLGSGLKGSVRAGIRSVR